MIAAATLSLLIAASGSLVDAALIPDGDYVVTVERVVDAKHILVKMDNGIESQIPAAATVTFDTGSRIQRAKIFVYKGLVITYKSE
jgi:hypothetical protein